MNNKGMIQDEVEATSSSSGSASLSLSSSALSLFATRSVSVSLHPGSDSVISSSIGSEPHTPPSISPSRSYPTTTSPYNYHHHSTDGFDATSKTPLRQEEVEEEEEDEIVLGYTNTLGPRPQPQPINASKFSAILKINALTGTATATANTVLPALLHPSHHPRSLWTLASHTEEEGYEPFVWAIFDSHEHALSALSALSTTHPPIAQPALESDLQPFSKLRKVDMKAWTARVSGGEHLHSFQASPGAYQVSDSPGPYSPMQRYSPTANVDVDGGVDAYSYSYPYSPTTMYSPTNTYPPALYHHSNYHHQHHIHQSNYTDSQQEITTTPIPLPIQPHKTKLEYDDDDGGGDGEEDHSTPIPPSHTPYNPGINPPPPSSSSHTTYSSEITYTYYASEMNHTRFESRKHHTMIDADGGVVVRGVNLDETGAGDETSTREAHRTTPHSPYSVGVAVAGSRSPITVAAAVAAVAAGSRSRSRSRSTITVPSGDGAEFPEVGAGAGQDEDVDGEAQGALNRQFFGTTRYQGASAGRAGRASESETVRVNVNVRGGEEGEGEREEAQVETTRPVENNLDVQVVWNAKGNELSILDRPREEGESNSSPDTGLVPDPGLAPSSSSSSFSFGASIVRDHSIPPSHSSNFTSHVTRPSPDSIGHVGGVVVGVDLDVDLVGAEKTKKIEMLHSVGRTGASPGRRSPGGKLECIEKSEWTATVGVYPRQLQPKPTPAETSFSPLPFPSNNDRDRDRADYGTERHLPPPDLSSSSSPSYLPLAEETRRAPDGDRVKTNFVPASSQTSLNSNALANANGNGNRIESSNASGASVGGGYGSLGRFSPMLDCPIRYRGVGEDEGYDDGGRDEMLRGRAGMMNYVEDEDAACALQSSALPPSHQTLQQFHQRDLQKQPFLHQQPPHSLPFFHQNQNQNQNQNQHQHQQHQHVYPTSTTATYAHTNFGVAPPTAFRHGDWLCNMPGCGAHNFGRNVSCIMCGAERAASAAVGVGLGFGYTAATAGTGRMQSSGGMSMGMGMMMTMDGDNELDGDHAYASMQGGANVGMGTGANAIGLNHGRLSTSNTFSSQSYSLRHASTHIPVIPRFGGQHYNVGAAPPQTTNGDIAMNSTLVLALGGIGQVAAIQEAIKAHQSQMQPQEGRGRLGAANNAGFAGQRHSNNGGRDGTFLMPAQGGQLLIPTTLGNSPPTSLPQGPIVVQQGPGARFGEARDGQGRNSNSMVPGVQHHVLPSIPSHYSQQGHPMQQNHRLQHPLPPHPGISASLLNPFSPASNALAAAVIPASKMPALLTPSGRKFAAGGRVQNISRDELNPLLMFWPDNEPLPLTSQIRPPAAVLMALGGVQGPPPPILNTGNKGPIDAQPGDWTCGKCDYLNWRRRRVCANCFPHAEGNTEGTKHSTNDAQERVALLASVIFQQQQQVQAQQRQIQSQQATAAAFASPPNESISRPGNTFAPASFVPSNVGPGMPSQQQSYAEVPRRNDAMPLSKMDSISMQLLAQKYGYAVPPPSGLRSATSTNSFEQPLPLNLPPRMTHPSASEGMMSRGFMDLNRNAPSFQPIRVDGVSQFDGLPQRLRSSPPSSRSSFSIGSNSSFYKSANEPTPSPLPLLPAFLQEVVGETSESSSSSVHESPSPPSPSSTSSAFGNTYPGDPRLSELVGAGLRRRERSSPASGASRISNNNIHRTASHSSIWSFGYPGDRKEGIRPV